ncbi:hypothetical protein GQ53DRAFT_696763 [Thozetella sp. PMI_491]|nr:hypothetical protein GQ53DRAFT_696763 [Thozetella sp. PMI_491]
MQESTEAPPTTPEEAPINSRAGLSVLYRQEIDESSRDEGQAQNILMSADSMFMSINMRFYAAGTLDFPGSFEKDIHDLWYTYYRSAINTADTSVDMDRLVVHLLQYEQVGVLMRRDGALATEAVTAGGRIWSDLPFFADDMLDLWTAKCAKMSLTQRSSFASFIAKAVSVGVDDKRLVAIGLQTLRDTFETRRPLGTVEDNDSGSDHERQMEDLSIASLLPAARFWLSWTRAQLVHYSESHLSEFPAEIGAVGALLHEEVSSEEITAGFSVKRWMFWLRRLEKISIEAERAVGSSENRLSRLANGLMDNMLSSAEEFSPVLQAAIDDDGGVVSYRTQVIDLNGATELPVTQS